EESLGEVELTGSAVRLLLTGSKGLVVTGLWTIAQDKQKKHQWNELEKVVQQIMNLQPHFITPWIFQSWNISYNVSVETDLTSDQYYFIARGIQLLAEGDRQNRNQPNMREMNGFYIQNKFGVSDRVHVLRSMFQLSCIEPGERDPDRYRTRDQG